MTDDGSRRQQGWEKERVDLQGLDDQQQGSGQDQNYRVRWGEDFGEQRRMMEGEEKEMRRR